MADWFSSGVQAMSGAFGGKSFNRGNPFTGSPSFGGGNVFDKRPNSSQLTFGGSGFRQNSSTFGQGRNQQQYNNPILGFEQRANENIARIMQEYQRSYSPGGTGQSMGQAAATGPSFAGGNLDDASGEINAASAKFGVPANLIKAIVARESSGHWGAGPNYDNTQLTYMPSRGYRIAGFSGITEPAAKAWGYNIEEFAGNRALQFEAVANGLSRLYQSYGGQYGWDGVIAAYYSGDPTAASTPSDSTQHGTTQQYLSQVKGWWNDLDAKSGSTGTYNANGIGGGGGSWMSAWGGTDAPITQEFGMTPFAADVLAGNQFAGMYDYGASVGVSGHAGLDIGLGYGTALYAPAGGTVVIAGGSGYYRDERGGDGPGRGELRVQMDNGDIYILGHMASINLVPGQRIEAGAMVGTSGSFNGSHLHYEVRKNTPGATSSGYTAVDPRQYFNGANVTQPSFNQAPQPSGPWFRRDLGSLFRS